MLIPKKNRREVYKYLFKGECSSAAPQQQPALAQLRMLLFTPYQPTVTIPIYQSSFNDSQSLLLLVAEGVLQAEKDFNLEQHPEVEVPNLHVIKLMQSFKSKELVTERFAWRHYYW
jgi:hypothetical protein